MLFRALATNDRLTSFSLRTNECTPAFEKEQIISLLSNNFTIESLKLDQRKFRETFCEVTRRNMLLKKQQRFKSVKPVSQGSQGAI